MALLNRYTLPRDLEGTVLGEIMAVKLREVEASEEKLPALSLRTAMERAPAIRSLKGVILRRAPAIIAEIKKASPSVGVFHADLDALELGRGYETAGAAAISVVTEVHHFQGSLENLACLRWSSRCPLLRKDFLVDSYQILESRYAGADAVLLIAALLDSNALAGLRQEAEELGMDTLVEVHDERELDRALDSGATLIGVNCRDLRTFDVSLDVCYRLGPRMPKEVVAVAESGIRKPEEILSLMDAGYRGFLIGELFMRAPSPGAALSQLVSACLQARWVNP